MSSHPGSFFAASFSLAFVAGGAQARTEVSTLDSISNLPIASMAAASAADASALPALLTAGGATLVVQEIEASAYTAIYCLERASDGKRVRVQIAGRRVGHASLAAGTVLTAKAIRTGVVLSARGEAIAFVPNALGRALLRAERMEA